MTEPDRTNPERREEHRRLEADAEEKEDWRLFGPYLSEREWGTVREDYSEDGECWAYLPHDHARSRAYRWGEDGLFGISDRRCGVAFALALWNARDPILKERLFGLSGPEGNHGEDVKELYYYLDGTPTYSYLAALYKYPQAEFPYDRLVEENRRRDKKSPEFEILDSGAFDQGRYFDVLVEYAKAAPDDILVRITCDNRANESAALHVLPTIWLRNTWSWGRTGDAYWPKGRITQSRDGIEVDHPSLGRFVLSAEGDERPEQSLFTENETNCTRLFGAPGARYAKDAFHRAVVHGQASAVNPLREGTKAAYWYRGELPPLGRRVLRLRLRRAGPRAPIDSFDALFERRRREADAFYVSRRNTLVEDEERRVARQADAGLVWSRQFYHFIVEHWLDGDPAQPAPPAARREGRNAEWRHVWASDVISMPDKWEYPWFAAWDLAFHAVATVRVDPDFAKNQVLLLPREWYMHPNGQLPAYEFAFGDANPPLFAWSAWRVYQLAASHGRGRDRLFLEKAFQKALVNFTWWVDRKDADGNNLFAGGFLGLDNIGVFDRSKPIGGCRMEQADATAWMAFYSTTMLAMALELATEDAAYVDMAPKFFEHFIAIARAMNAFGTGGLWDETDGYYYDHALIGGVDTPLRVRSMVGVIPLFAAESLEEEHLHRVPAFRERLEWTLENRPEWTKGIACMHPDGTGTKRLLAIPSPERLTRVLRYVLDESELLSPFGVRSLSKYHAEHPFVLDVDGEHYEVHYAPGNSDTGLFGGNSNWRGPVWMPLNYLLIEALKRHHHFYRDSLTVECPVGSGRYLTLGEVAEELERRLSLLFLPDASGRRPCHGGRAEYATDAHFRELVLFHEYFDAETGQGLGASHQTGWTALTANVLERVAAARSRRG